MADIHSPCKAIEPTLPLNKRQTADLVTHRQSKPSGVSPGKVYPHEPHFYIVKLGIQG